MSSARQTALRRAWLVTKPFLMPAIAARFASKPRGPGFRRVLTAQTFSWGGDIALMGEGRRPFLAGLGSFLVAHVAYISAFRSRSSVPLLASPGRRRFLLGSGLLSGGMALAVTRKDPKLAAPVAAYGATLATMVASAAAIDHDRGRGLVLPGAALFLLSDSLIGARMFLAGERTAALDSGVMTTYVAAQWCISEGMSGP
jgi:uncharacterized membrane protein YhhN